uniref:(northern house mosquito) hypothetical protein n=1 Tax=Culex pipiens TaxID=7175 RepID=A0A8D8I3B7_CULPI
MFKAHHFLALIAIVAGQSLEKLPYPDVYQTSFNPGGGQFQLVDCHPTFSPSYYGVDHYYQTGYPYEVKHRHPSLEWYPEVREVQNPSKQFSFTVKLSEKKRNKEVMARPTKKVVQKTQSDPELVGAVNPAATSQDNHPDIPMDDKTFDKICDKIKVC